MLNKLAKFIRKVRRDMLLNRLYHLKQGLGEAEYVYRQYMDYMTSLKPCVTNDIELCAALHVEIQSVSQYIVRLRGDIAYLEAQIALSTEKSHARN